MKVVLQGLYSLNRLEKNGCKVDFDRSVIDFSLNWDTRPPMDAYLEKIPDEWDGDHFGWAPDGFVALGLSALIAVGMEFPNLQKTLTITATGAVFQYENNFPVYPYLGMNQEQKRILTVTMGLFTPFPLRNEYKIDLWGVFAKANS